MRKIALLTVALLIPTLIPTMAFAQNAAVDARKGTASATAPAEVIAAGLRTALKGKGGYEALLDVVEPWIGVEYTVLHDPPAPTVDGPIPGSRWRAGGAAEVAVFTKLMPDFQMNGTARADGDKVIIDMTLSGTLAGGRRLNTPVRQTYFLKDGKIVSCITKTLDPKELQAFTEATSDALNETPEFKRAREAREKQGSTK